MKYRALVLVVGFGLLSIASLWTYRNERRAPRPQRVAVQAGDVPRVAARDPEPAPVRIEQRLVRVDAVSEPPAPAQRRLAAARGTPPRKTGLFARARRVLFGEGRHKPAPFPGLQ